MQINDDGDEKHIQQNLKPDYLESKSYTQLFPFSVIYCLQLSRADLYNFRRGVTYITSSPKKLLIKM